MADLNLTEWEQALREERGTAPTIEYGDRTWTLPALCPWILVEVQPGLVDGDGKPTRNDASLVRAARVLLDDQYGDFTALNPSMAGVIHLVDTAHQAYTTTPKSEGSSEPSTSSGKPKPRTKKRSAAH